MPIAFIEEDFLKNINDAIAEGVRVVRDLEQARGVRMSLRFIVLENGNFQLEAFPEPPPESAGPHLKLVVAKEKK